AKTLKNRVVVTILNIRIVQIQSLAQKSVELGIPAPMAGDDSIHSRWLIEMPLGVSRLLEKSFLPPIHALLSPSAHYHSLHEAEKSMKMHSSTNPRLIPRFTRFLTPAYNWRSHAVCTSPVS
ncbi:hypothetical protein, partial [Ferrovum sp.]|uniref:hypothetical protein n=1 Tax=Ferrovum sp. TaxID=2609467 RepID=UPI0026017EF6